MLLADVVPFAAEIPLGSPKYKPPSNSRTISMSAPHAISCRSGEHAAIEEYEVLKRLDPNLASKLSQAIQQ